MTHYKALDSLDLTGKTVILRVDFNCPIDRQQGQINLSDTKRIDDHVTTTIIPLFNKKKPPRNILLLAHQGRHGQSDCTTFRPHFRHLKKQLLGEGIQTEYVWSTSRPSDVIAMGNDAVASDRILTKIHRLGTKSVLLLENVRIGDEENSNEIQDGKFEKNSLLQMLKEVNNSVVALDGFSVAHRAQPSVVGLNEVGPIYAGPVVMRELDQLARALDHPEEPMILIVGGAKVGDSLRSVERFLEEGKAHKVLTAGLVGLTILAAKGIDFNGATMSNLETASDGRFDEDKRLAQKLLLKFGEQKLRFPSDLAIGPDICSELQRIGVPVEKIDELLDAHPNHAVGDIGVMTIAEYNDEIVHSRTIVINGPMGRYEWPGFQRGTEEILRYIGLAAAEVKVHALLGGGNTGDALKKVPVFLAEKINVCTSGKAFLQVLASGNVNDLPGILALARD